MMNIIKKFAATFNENMATVICGMAMMNGCTNTFTMYKAMTDADRK
jgi:hypothetical protein